jgi:DNA-binding transcriptional regulator YiaG
MDRVAWPICKITCKVQKPSNIPQNPTSLGEYIKKRRLEQGLSQKELSEMLNVNECTIWNWENNYFKPQKRFIPKTIEFFGYKVNEV